ncbi:hypothetical protein KCU71_g1142, partial [Aureobasidium melanogenum]
MAHTAEAEEAFARIKDDIAHKLKAAFVLQDRPDKTFLPVEKAKGILLEFMLNDLTDLCNILAMNEQQKDHICLVLAILLCIHEFSLVHWKQFRKYLGQPFKSLPLDSEEAYEAFDYDLGRLFYEEQFAFCPVVLEERKVNNYTGIKSRCKLPYLEEVKIGSGSFGTVYKVKIPRGHLQGTYYNTTTLARKDFRIAAQGRESFEKEWETMQQILQARDLHANIMRTFASLKLDSQLSIFYPLATCNLAEYLDNSKGFSASFCDRLKSGAGLYEAKRKLFIQVRDLAEALKTLHQFQNRDATMASCFHMDLKPENILVCVQDDSSEIWKLSDFGISRVEKIKDRASNVRITLDLDRVFVQNRNEPHPQVTAPGGGGTYMAPEAQYLKSKITNKCDVWSLACVVLLVMSFAHRGPEEVKSFKKGLSRGGKGSDWFFVAQTPKNHLLPFKSKKFYKGPDEDGVPTLYVQNPYMKECLGTWTSTLQNSCKEFYQTLSKILLDEALLPDPRKRIDAATFFDRFSDCFTKHLPDFHARLGIGGDVDKPRGHYKFGDLHNVPIAHAMLSPGSANSVAFVASSGVYVYETSPPYNRLLHHPQPPFEKCQMVSLDVRTAETTPIKSIRGSIQMCAVSPRNMFLAFVTKESKHSNGFQVHVSAKDDLFQAGAYRENNKLWQNIKVDGCTQVMRLQFSPDGRFLQAVFVLQPNRRSGAKILIWDIESGKCIDNRVIPDRKGNDDPYGFVSTSQFVGQGHSTEAQVVVLTEGRYLNAIDIPRPGLAVDIPRPGPTVCQDLGRAHRVIDFVIDASTGLVFYLARVGGSNTVKVFCGPYPVRTGGKWESKDVTPADALIPPNYDASTDSLYFNSGFPLGDEKYVAPKIMIATVKGSLLTFDVSLDWSSLPAHSAEST